MRSADRSHRIARSGAALLLAGVALLLGAAPAWAHNVLVGSDPMRDATLSAAPGTVQLTFDQPLQDGPGFTTLALTGPGGSRWPLTGVVVDSTVVSGKVGPLGPPGIYRLGYRVLSADGHPVSGQIEFTVAATGTGTPLPANSAPPADGSGGGIPIWMWIAGAAVLLAVGVVGALRLTAPGSARR